MVRDRWSIELGASYGGGTAGYVAKAVGPDSTPCVVKIAMPLDIDERDAVQRAVAVHELAAGAGCARLLHVDLDASVLVLEQLGPNLDELGLDVTTIVDTITATLQAFWRPLEEIEHRTQFPSGAEKARWHARHLETWWQRLGHPCDRRGVDRALDYCEQRAAAFDPDRAVLLHGDAHGWNTVKAGPGAYKFVDPEGLWGEPEIDLSVPMREYNEPLLAGDTKRLTWARAERLASMCNVEVEAVWQWGFIERVSTGFVNLHDFEDGDRSFLEVAERCL